MEVSVLLKQLDCLNEEGQEIQNEIKRITSEISSQQYAEEKTKASIFQLTKKMKEMVMEDEHRVVEQEIELERQKQVHQQYATLIQKQEVQIHQLFISMDELANTLHELTEKGINTISQSQKLVLDRIQMEKQTQEKTLLELDSKITQLHRVENDLQHKVNKEKEDIQNMIIATQSLHNTIAQFDTEIATLQRNIDLQEIENVKYKE